MFRPENAQSLLGLALVLLVCWALSEDRSRFPWRLALGALAVQVGLVLTLFGLPGARSVVRAINDGVDGLAAATAQGTQFVFGYLAGGAQPYVLANEGALFVFAFQV
ncbi:MAG TPA: Na+ dependent nucleoside transporter N-terminal domain-containing protein, partial [Phenylobacterium sp.]|nr:Na+ dependent nucleoside transporter N-terminal domain-containing protein [Phenylobacterium sp.]